MLNDCPCHSGTPVQRRCHPGDPGWARCFMKEETTVFHLFKSLEVISVDRVPWDKIQENFVLSLQEILHCKTIVQEELDMAQKMGSKNL